VDGATGRLVGAGTIGTVKPREVERRLDGLRQVEASPPDDLSALPAPARRYLSHALGEHPGTASGVRMRMRGSVVQSDRRLALSAQEILAPPHGFVWRARARIGPMVVTVRDFYYERTSRVDVRLLGIVPMGGERGPDTMASSRGRLAAEAVWVPSMLMPRPGVRWSDVDDDCAQVHLLIDGVEESLTLRVDPEGRLVELWMHRWGDVRVEHHQNLPYGFRVVAERRFDRYTIPSQLEGGWWYGTERYDAQQASRFTIEAADYA
jgi:hypothetical protein